MKPSDYATFLSLPEEWRSW